MYACVYIDYKITMHTWILILQDVTIYYDYEPNIGINATCVDWSPRNEFFSSWSEFLFFVNSEYPTNAQLVEITSENYSELCAMGVFYES